MSKWSGQRGVEVRRGAEADANARSTAEAEAKGRSSGGWKYAAAPNCTDDHRGTGERAANLDTRRPVVPLGGCKTLRDT